MYADELILDKAGKMGCSSTKNQLEMVSIHLHASIGGGKQGVESQTF